MIGAALSKPDFPSARAFAHEALRLDPANADGLIALAWLSAVYEWNWKRSEEEFRRAIDLDASRSSGYHGLADLLIDLGRFDEALAAAEATVERDPLSPLGLWELAYAQYMAGRYDDALATFARVFEVAPDFVPLCDLPTIYLLSGRKDEALHAAREAAAKNGNPTQYACLAYVLASADQREEAESTLRQALAGGDDAYVVPEVVAWAYAALGDMDAAFRWIRKGMDDRDYSVVQLDTHPNFAPLRSDPRFGEMVREMGLGG